MRFVDEFRDPAAARALVKSITELATGDEFKFMEVCGGHTHTIYRHGIEHLLPEEVELVHGPGCPVCVSPMGRVDDAIALAAIDETMELREDFEWRGLGTLPRSALRLRSEFARWDAEELYALPGARIEDPKACRCGEVLTGQIKPWECGVFGTACTPERPLGTCMVSSEGACAAFYAYGRQRRPVEETVGAS